MSEYGIPPENLRASGGLSRAEVIDRRVNPPEEMRRRYRLADELRSIMGADPRQYSVGSAVPMLSSAGTLLSPSMMELDGTKALLQRDARRRLEEDARFYRRDPYRRSVDEE